MNNTITDNINHKKYNILLANNQKNINIMYNHFNDFLNSQNLKLTNGIICIDFEFNQVSKTNKDVSIIQINLETNNIGTIYIIELKLLNQKQVNKLIELLTNTKIHKIIHGGEALDIPYLFEQLFNKDTAKIKNFLTNFYDTKYLCEFFHIINGKTNKCSIYDLYKEQKVINSSIYKQLNNIENIIGPIHTIDINMNNIICNQKIFEYVIYDVRYLGSLFNKLKKNTNKHFNILSEITQHSYYYNKVFNQIFFDFKTFVDSINNNFIVIKNENIKLNEIYYWFILTCIDNNNLINLLLEITYFKFFIEIIVKFIVYNQINNKYIIYKSKNVPSALNFKIHDNNLFNKILFGKNTIDFCEKIQTVVLNFI